MRVLLTCGIGDFIAMDPYFTALERTAVRSIHWASRAREALQDLVPFVFPNVTENVIERDKFGPAFSRTFCIHSRDDLPGLDAAVLDFSVGNIARDVKAKRRTFVASSFTASHVADVSRFNLPPRFFVVHPYSENARTPIRDLTGDEWILAHRRIRALNAVPVIVNKGPERLAALPGTIDLTNETTLPEAIEITKRSSGYIGAASLFSVVAAKTLPAHRLVIKGSRDLKFNFSAFYYAPHATHAVVTCNLTRTLREPCPRR